MHELFKFGPREFHDEVLGTIGATGDKRLIDFGFLGGREFDLGFFG